MRYNVGGREIRTENTAKPPARAAAPLVSWIRKNVSVERAMDYGCGRLRYAGVLAGSCSKLLLVDSAQQLDRTTTIAGRTTTIRAYATKKWPHAEVVGLAEFGKATTQEIDFALCANVLPVIPSPSARRRSLNAIRQSLAPGGQALFVCQHTNSYFTAAQHRPGAVAYLDGWTLDSPNYRFYFGILSQDKVCRLVTGRGFRVRDCWIDGQSNYVLCSR